MFSLIRELYRYFIDRKKYWLLPIVIIFLVFGYLVIVSEGSAVSSLLYTLF